MALQEKLLGQARPGSTTAATLYTCPASTTAIIKNITISNTTAGALTYRLFATSTGSTYDETTALAWDISLAAGATDVFDSFMALTAAGTLGVRTSSASGLTFTAFGAEIT